MRLGSRGRLALAATALGLVGAQAIATPASGLAAADDGYGKNSWWYQAMGLAEAHKTSTGKGVTVALIDGPIDLNVPELRGRDVKAVKSFCGNKPTGTGKIADHATRAAVNLVGNGRGTAPGGVGVAGIAPDATLRVYSVDDQAAEGLQCGNPAGIVEAVSTAVQDGAQILSLSFGVLEFSTALEEVLQEAFRSDAVVVAAVGNAPVAKTVSYPAAYPGVVAVAAVDRNANPWKQNVAGNREAFVISAAGVDLKTGAFDGSRWRSDANVSGTSEATPLVAGGLALVRAKYPEATANQVIQNLIRNPGGTRTFGHDTEVGYGVMSVPKMLASDPSQWPDENPLQESRAPSEGSAPGDAQADGSPVSAAGPAEDEGGGSTALVAGGIAVLVAVLVAAVFLLSRRRSAGSRHG